MKRLTIHILIIALLLVAADWAVGIVYNRALLTLPHVASIVETDRHRGLMPDSCPQVLLLGSSRTKHEYVSRMIADSLHRSVFNAGIDGMGANYSMIVLETMLERGTPQCVVLDVLDAMMSDKWINDVDEWDCYYGLNDAVACYIDSHTSWQKRLKMHSNLYRFNNVTTWILKSYAMGDEPDPALGYTPLVGTDPLIAHKRYHGFEANDIEVESLNRIVALCRERGIALHVFLSPNYEHNIDFNAWMASYCTKHNVPLSDYTTAFDGHPELFVEASHLNDHGAERYTGIVIGHLKTLLQ